MKLKLLDLFSGIGGFSLGLESTGYFETIGFVEKDEFCQKVLKKNFNNIPIESEVRNVKGDSYKADIITGGFPCQPFSVAGKRRGTEDDRYLWDETIRVIRECKPRWFIGENVEGIINIQEGMVLADRCVMTWKKKVSKSNVLLFQLQASVRGIKGKGFGLLHNSNSNRDRTKITGSNGEEKEIQREHRDRKTVPPGNLLETNTNDVPNTKSKGSFSSGRSNTSDNEQQRLDIDKERNWSKIRSKSSRCSEQTLPNTNSKGSQRHGVSTDMETKQRQVITEGSIKEQQTWWEAQSKLCRTPDGISYELDKDRKNRIKSLGNSIVPLDCKRVRFSYYESRTRWLDGLTHLVMAAITIGIGSTRVLL
jgi:DNA (cytosine-5)-methyltransferase 1